MKCYLASVAALILAVAASAEPAKPTLENALLLALRDAQFSHVMDFGPGNENHPLHPAAPVAHTPNVDVAVIQLDAEGRWVAAADVLLSRDYPDGQLVLLGRNSGASLVRFRRWDMERWDGGNFSEAGKQLSRKGWTNNPPLTAADDIVPGRTNAPYQFMAAYPASLFKLMVAFHVMRMVDAGKLTLDTEYNFRTNLTNGEPRRIRNWLEPMLTVSDNHATSALLKMMHDRNEIEPLNKEFRELGLGTLQINHTSPSDGRGWSPGQIHMTAFDTARLLWVIDGGPGELWRGANGQPVTANLLSDASREFLKKLLSDQGLNETLTTANLAGLPNVRPGIPSRVATRWINPLNGFVNVDGLNYGVDIRASNTNAEVNFAHKTGLTFNYGSDAGIVTSLPGKPFRHYIVAFLGNLGYRYTDDVFASRTNYPVFNEVGPISYTQKIPALGKAIDDAVKKLSAPAN